MHVSTSKYFLKNENNTLINKRFIFKEIYFVIYKHVDKLNNTGVYRDHSLDAYLDALPCNQENPDNDLIG